jgi:hypothetical protein
VSYFKHAAQGLEEKKQILYLLGPVGGGKSSLAEKLKALMEVMPFYALKGFAGQRIAARPVLIPRRMAPCSKKEYGIPRRYLTGLMSPWAVKRLHEFNGDISQVPRGQALRPSVSAPDRHRQDRAGRREQPGHLLAGRQGRHPQAGAVCPRTIPDAYSYSGGLCLANQGLLEFVEMFKAPIKVLHPLLTATQEGNYKGTEGFGAIPFDGIIMAHSNESEWLAFKNNRNNEAFLDRIYIVKVPYCLRVSEEVRIYEKLLPTARCRGALRARHAGDDGAVRGAVAPEGAENSSIYSKMRVYDGENLKDTDPKAKSYQEYRDFAGVDEGMTGLSTRFAFKVLSKVFNFDTAKFAANPVHLMYVLEQQIEQEQFPPEVEQRTCLHQGIPGAALRRIHRQGDPDRLSEVVFRIRPEHLRPLRHLRRLLDPGRGLPRPRHRRDFRPRAAQRGAGEDREAGRHQQPEGLPQRDRQLRAARPRQERRQEPGLDQLREAARGDREEDVLQHRGPAAGDLLQRQGLGDDQKKHQTSSTHDRQGLHREAGAPAVRMVFARAQVVLRPAGHGLPKRSSRSRISGQPQQERRQPAAIHAPLQAARSAKAVADAVKPALDHRSRFRREGLDPGARTSPSRISATAGRRLGVGASRATTSSSAGDRIPRPQGGAGGRAAAAANERRRARTTSSSAVARGVPRLLLRRPGAAQPGQDPARHASREYKSARRLHPTGTPANINVVRSLRGAHRPADRAGRRASGGDLRARELNAWKICRPDARTSASALQGEIERLRARIDRMPFIDTFDLRYNNRIKVPQPTAQAVMFCIMDVSGSMDEARRTSPSASSCCSTCS